MSAPAMAHDPSDAMRRSSASSSSSDFNDHGMPVVPFHESMSGMTIEKPTILHAHKPHVMPALALNQIVNDPSSYSESDQSSLSETSSLEPSAAALPVPRGGTGGSSGMSLQSPPPRSQGAAFTFEEVMSPRHQNGKRYLGGYLNQRVSMAGGFLKTWKRKYFRLRDHGMLCFKHQDDTTPLFEIHFKAQSVLLVDKPHGALPSSPSAVSSPHATMGYEDAVMLQTTKGKVNASLLFILKHIEIQGHQTPANKVDVPVYLKAENDVEFHAWVENVRLKMEARKRALMQNTVEVAVEGDAAAAKSPATAKNDANLPPRPRIGSTGESVSFSERHGSVPGTDGRTESPAGAHDRTASMSNITEMRSGNGLSTTTAQSNEKTKLQFVAGSTPDPPEFSTFRSKYLLMKEIGEGSFSIVHRAVNRLTGQLCAVKCCKFSHALEEEVMILRKLSHPNIISLEGVYMQEDMFYVVVDYMEDGDLCERLIQKQRFSEAEARQIITQVLLGLEYLHRNNILHRDLKPENILLHGNVVKIADFGLARQLPAATSMLKRSCGTLEYAAPELLRGQAYGLKSDIFSLGVVLYVLLFGTFPFTIESAAALQRMERFPEGVDVRDMSCLHRDSAQWKQISGLAQDVLLRMLSPTDKDRMSAKELLAHPWFNLTNTPNPVGTPSMGSDTEREAQRIQDCRSKGFAELLARGLDVIKYGKAGNTSPHLTTLQIDFVHGTISWTARGGVLGIGGTQSNRKITDNVQPTSSKKRGARVVSLSDVQEIRVGHTTDAFHAISGSGREPPAAELCVSIVATWRTLDFVVKAIEQRDFVVAGLTRTLEEYRSKHRQS